MRQVTAKKLAAELDELLIAAQDEAILVMRAGKPSTLILGVENHHNYDAEDWGYMTDPEFWRMIRERRADQRPGIPLAEVMRRLQERERTEPRQARGKRRTTRTKGKRNAIA